jgi:hypothetical protein
MGAVAHPPPEGMAPCALANPGASEPHPAAAMGLTATALAASTFPHPPGAAIDPISTPIALTAVHALASGSDNAYSAPLPPVLPPSDITMA